SFWIGVATVTGLAFARVAVEDGRSSERAEGFCAAAAAAYDFDFLGCQGARAGANQYSVVMVDHRFLLCEVEPLAKPDDTVVWAEADQHSPGSPSLKFGGMKLHLVVVWRPPFTCSTSCRLSSRAPLRTSTLLFSWFDISFFSFFNFESRYGARWVAIATQERRGGRPRLCRGGSVAAGVSVELPCGEVDAAGIG